MMMGVRSLRIKIFINMINFKKKKSINMLSQEFNTKKKKDDEKKNSEIFE